MGDRHEQRGDAPGAAALEPSSALTFAEAAVLAGVEPERIAELAASGALLCERARRGRREQQVVRLIDLADVFPHVLGRPEPEPEPKTEPEPELEPAAPLPEVDVPRPGAGPTPAPGEAGAAAVEAPAGGDLAGEVLASGASRGALIELAQDLEARLDLAERERRASTASLLMAQRRVLDLEARLGRRPWARVGARVGGGALLLLSTAALVAVLRVPGMVREAAAEEARGVRAAAAEELAGLRRAAADALAAREAEAERVEAALGAAADRAAEAARIAREGRAAAREQVEAERARAEGQRAALNASLSDLEERLRAAEERDRMRSAELEVARDAASRERARFDERLAEAQRVARDIRGALEDERRLSAEDRARFQGAVDALAARLEQSTLALERLGEAEAARARERDARAAAEAADARDQAAPRPDDGPDGGDPPGVLLRLLKGLLGRRAP